MENIFIVIPTLNPDVDLLENFVKNLKKDFKNILIVNDGCRKEYDDFFENLEKDGVEVIKHYINMGKGRALKDAFNYLLNKYPKLEGIVTADSDGQHSIKDIKKCAELVKKNPESLILGSRDFDQENVPKRSRFGNKLTRGVLKSTVGITLKDTQTGLRGLSKEVMTKFVTTDGERFDYETKQLIDCAYLNVDIIEYKIETIYINNNAESHYNAVTDSIRIAKMFMKFFFYSFTYWLFDLLIFALILCFKDGANAILISTIIARIIASVYKYITSERLKCKGNAKKIITYIIKSFVQMILSGAIVQLICASLTNPSIIWVKIIVDILIFVSTILVINKIAFGGKLNEK